MNSVIYDLPNRRDHACCHRAAEKGMSSKLEPGSDFFFFWTTCDNPDGTRLHRSVEIDSDTLNSSWIFDYVW